MFYKILICKIRELIIYIDRLNVKKYILKIIYIYIRPKYKHFTLVMKCGVKS